MNWLGSMLLLHAIISELNLKIHSQVAGKVHVDGWIESTLLQTMKTKCSRHSNSASKHQKWKPRQDLNPAIHWSVEHCTLAASFPIDGPALVQVPDATKQCKKITSGWWFETLWKILVNWDDYSKYMGKSKMFQTTNHIYIYIHIKGR